MALPDTETILTAAGLVATAVVWAVERFLPGRKRIGYRVQMDTAIGMNPQDAHSLVQLRLLRQVQEISDATLALLRFENDGGKDIVRQDYERARLTRCEVNGTKSLLDAVDRVPGALGYAEGYAAAQRKHVVSVRLNGHEPDIEWGRQRDYPFWTVEYLYTYGRPEDGSLTAKFLAFMDSDTAKNIMRMYKHVPCADRQSLPATVCRP
ncbi:hypothetical protein [Streptomyces lydicus]|uniref:hypothetical protein n=1 Tax=Streptomyces lydicus TaxID=47763 RepID=UPI002870A092|nr:hypothetical protein [Streptomyces lydicus]